ncbi:hypothetical protein BV898_12793 [Hypsibius exemplaris]|uniref:Uncharacterized protein n=1 Tax=Hypsibius exemplaris TaxID=2072580 RepID=A0A1W0WCL3_HYPEX|nr:hypothetical protein BV898_12793 [Hypsibius exemplaris]
MANYGKSTESARERNKDVFFCVLSANPKSAESRPYESFMQDAPGWSPHAGNNRYFVLQQTGPLQRRQILQRASVRANLRFHDEKYEPSPSKVSYEIKLYMPKHDASPEYPVKPYAPPPGYMHYPYEDIPDYAYEERSLYFSPKYEQQKMPYMKPYYSPDGEDGVMRTDNLRRGYLEAVYGSQYPENGRSREIPSFSQTYRPVYKEVYEPSYKAEAPSYRPAPTPTPYELTTVSLPVFYKPSEPTTYESAPKQIYREIDATYDPPPPQSTYQSYYKTKS